MRELACRVRGGPRSDPNVGERAAPRANFMETGEVGFQPTYTGKQSKSIANPPRELCTPGSLSVTVSDNTYDATYENRSSSN